MYAINGNILILRVNNKLNSMGIYEIDDVLSIKRKRDLIHKPHSQNFLDPSLTLVLVKPGF